MTTTRQIRRYVSALVDRFQPERVILFGSYAYGRPTEDSDVDLLVVMEHRGAGYSQATRMRCAVPAPFAMDMLVRRPAELAKLVSSGDVFFNEVVGQGKVLHD